ncbi:MAG: DUF2520 domain-containing protein [Bacteroidales bacterium]|nr:DUF2520 domain-containing protein [Bacteroidales bacterium]MCF8390516.1 DUF2520 domain-containing protein [Bacteroidales bacterium]
MDIHYNFVVIGAGNLGTRLSLALKKAGHTPLHIISRDQKKAGRLADKLGASYGSELNIDKKADIVFITVNDDSIPKIVKALPKSNALYVHSSGSTALSVFDSFHENYGVFYPLQSFTADVKINFRKIPILLETTSNENYYKLENIANSISDNVLIMDSETRLKSHVGAIIAANLGNHIICLGENYLVRNNIPVEIIHPLLDEMVRKIKELGAKNAQTGPARRKDMGSIKKHIELLKDDTDLQKMYTFVSNSIVNFYSDSNSED